MYRHCIYCSADFGLNTVFEEFPVGRQVAFDEWRGRLWAICPRCTRWNLAPIEERWEVVEAAEKTFRDARLRVQSENVGLAKLPDGTRLVRVGKAIPGELAAWRYGGQLLRRRKRHLALSGVGVAAGLAAVGGLSAIGFTFVGFYSSSIWIDQKLKQRIVHRVAAHDERGARALTIRRWHVPGLRLLPAADPYDLQLEIRDAHRDAPAHSHSAVDPESTDIVVLAGGEARSALTRAMVRVNNRGASKDTLREADRILSESGSAHRVLREASLGGAALGDRAGANPHLLTGAGALAFEMALHEEYERRALEGELGLLESAWQEAEEIAAIADALPGEETLARVLERLRL